MTDNVQLNIFFLFIIMLKLIFIMKIQYPYHKFRLIVCKEPFCFERKQNETNP